MLILCTVLHFTVDGICGAVLAGYAVIEPDYSSIVYYFTLYNIIAFGGQFLAGFILDIRDKLILPALAAVPVLLGLSMFPHLGTCVQAVLLGVGNCIFHVSAGILVLRRYSTYAEPGLFVSSGAVGLALGLHQIVPAPVFMTVCLFATIALVRDIRKYPEISCEISVHPSASSSSSALIGAVILILCIILRGFSGGGTEGVPVNVMLLPCVFALGKYLGGLVCDHAGFRKTILIIFVSGFTALQIPVLIPESSFASVLPLLILALSANMTMPLTLRLLHWCCPKYPGLMFGLAAGCLLPGALLGGNLSILPHIIIVVQFLSLFAAGYIFRLHKEAA